jgi:putative peptidoglycan lipid II flippase
VSVDPSVVAPLSRAPEAGRVPWRRRDAALVSGLTLAAQLVTLAVQVVFATFFGASPNSDAFFAALALPLYLSAVLVSALAVVFLPIFVEQRSLIGSGEADRVASAAINLTVLVLGGVAVAGVLFASPLLALSAPGLPPPTQELASELAAILWPSIVGSGLVAILTARWQVDGRFGWPAAVPFVGAAANLALLVTLTPLIGAFGAAVAWTASLSLQAVLLTPVALRTWSPSLLLRHPAILALAVSIAPLALANVFIRASLILERYLGSQLPPGDLSHLTYASRIVLAIGVFVAAGPGTVIFPRLAEDVAVRDRSALAERVASGLRSLWLVIAPVLALTIALADHGTRLVFERGAFTREDADTVASLVRLYAPAIAGIGLAAVSAHALYALRVTRILASVGAAEGLAYVVYTAVLARSFGAAGIALGFSAYYLISVAWQLLYVRRVTSTRGMRLIGSFAVTGGVAVVAGLAAWAAAAGWSAQPLVACAVGSGIGVVTYGAGLTLVRGLKWRRSA